MARKDFTQAAQDEEATAGEVQQALAMIAKAGFEIDATAYVHAKRGRERLEELLEKHGTALEPQSPDEHCFFFKKGDIHVSLSWDIERNSADVGIHNGAIGVSGTTQDYTVREFLAAAPFDKPVSAVQQAAETLPEQWRKPFLKFVETGEGDEALLTYLDRSKEGAAAVETVFNLHAAAMENLAEELRRLKPPKGPKP